MSWTVTGETTDSGRMIAAGTMIAGVDRMTGDCTKKFAAENEIQRPRIEDGLADRQLQKQV